MKNKLTTILVLLWTVIWQLSCSGGPKEDCARHIQEEIHPGLPMETAEAALRSCGFTTTTDSKATIDPAKKLLYGDKRLEGFPVTERLQVLITPDSNNRVASVKVTSGLIGP
jgi:hypothetical protein